MRGCRQVYWLQLALGDLRIDDRFDVLLANCEGGFHVTLDQARGDVEGVLKGGREDCVWVKHLVAKQVNPPIVNKKARNKKEGIAQFKKSENENYQMPKELNLHNFRKITCS